MIITLDNVNDNLFIGNKFVSTLFYEGFKEAMFLMHPAFSKQIKGLDSEQEFYDWIAETYDNVKNLNKYFPRECEQALNKINHNSFTTFNKIEVDTKLTKAINDNITTDNVNHPSHYTQGKVECIDALDAATEGLSGIEAVCTANAIKYLWRWKHKNGVEDLKKAAWYINHLIHNLDKTE